MSDMDRAWLTVLLLISCFEPAELIDTTLVKVTPADGSVAGVFQASYGDYAFNVSVAREVCQALGAVMASKGQVQLALRHGLETCKFGWVDEQIAVIPRIQSNPRCGNSGVGIVPWRVDVSRKFDVFCFSETDFEAQMKVTTNGIQPSTPETSGTASSFLSAAGDHLTRSSNPSLSVPDSPLSSTSPTISPSLHPSPSGQGPQPISSTHATIGAAPTALLITALFALLLAATTALWHFRRKHATLPCWEAEPQKEYIEAEVWERSGGQGEGDGPAPTPPSEEEPTRRDSSSSVQTNTDTHTDDK